MHTQIKNEEVLNIVKIHLETLKDDLLPQLGGQFLTLFYQYINKSSLEQIFIIKDKDELLGACILSFESNTLLQRVLKNMFIPFSINFVRSFTFNKLFRRYIINIIINKSKIISKDPEISYIFLNPLYQNKGIGTKLIRIIDKELLQRGYKTYYVKTLDCTNNKAIRFYKKNDFKILYKFKYAGKSYLYLKKNLK